MKRIIFLLLATVILKAEEPPDYMRDGVITVTLKDGKVYTYSTNEWMVVRRGMKSKPATTADQKHYEEPMHHVNRVRVMVGAGPKGLQSEQRGQVLHVESRIRAVAGFGYDHALSNRWSLNGSAYTNGTVSLGVGYDF